MNRPSEAIANLRIAFEKGYRDFIHIEHDDDLDNIRKSPKFIELVNEWKKKAPVISSISEQTLPQGEEKTVKQYVVKTKELKSGVYEIPCTVNDLPLKFIFDTGASTITISSLDAAFMLKNNYLNEYDFGSKRNYRTASGDIIEGTKIRLRKVKIGEMVLENIEASVVHKQNAPLLFGQSALGKFAKISIDNTKNEIIFER
jgi:clan AA aspartic protease (TIGR02281 family)